MGIKTGKRKRIIITKHADRRLRRRVGLPRRAHKRHMRNIQDNGINQHEASGDIQNYMMWKLNKNGGEASRALMYGHFIYLFSGNILITILQIPGKLVSQADECYRNHLLKNGTN